MIKANELRLKNLVLNDNSVCEINHIYGMDFINCSLKTKQGNCINAHYDLIEPIPLTEEWLLKHGYKRDENKKRFGNGYDYQPEDVFTEWFCFKISDSVFYRFSNWHHSCGVDNEDCLIWHGNEIRRCEYVHQLQNLYFALTGEELTLSD